MLLSEYDSLKQVYAQLEQHISMFETLYGTTYISHQTATARGAERE
jgi:hypothetical protein